MVVDRFRQWFLNGRGCDASSDSLMDVGAISYGVGVGVENLVVIEVLHGQWWMYRIGLGCS